MSYDDFIASQLGLDDSKPAQLVAAILGELQNRRGFDLGSFDSDVLHEMGQALTEVAAKQLPKKVRPPKKKRPSFKRYVMSIGFSFGNHTIDRGTTVYFDGNAMLIELDDPDDAEAAKNAIRHKWLVKTPDQTGVPERDLTADWKHRALLAEAKFKRLGDAVDEAYAEMKAGFKRARKGTD
jgi:hypothetical protein